MPFNLLLLPLLAGYLYLAKSHLRSYWVSQLQKEQLLLAAATYGLMFLVLSRAAVLLILCTDAGREFARLFHQFAPFPYSGTSLGTVILAAVAWNFSNLFVNEQAAGFWLYHRKDFDPLTGVFWQSSIGVRPQSAPSGLALIWRMVLRIASALAKPFWRLLRNPARLRKNAAGLVRELRGARARGYQLAGFAYGVPKPVMLNLNDSKVVVGLIVDLPANKPTAEFVTILPLWTGYRDSASRRLFKTVDYEEALKRVDDAMDLSRVIRIEDIASASIWSESAFQTPASAEGITA
ncbi:hypothetical protein [Lysobacter soli]|uniref:hypothetical protein n=1 Tax=Lysobacter soli TaxID=453783 RepID=UPI003CF1BBA0